MVVYEGQPIRPANPEPSLAGNQAWGGSRDKCSYCVDIQFHAPHLYDMRQCTCASRTVQSVDSASRDSSSTTTILSAPRSGPRYDPQQLLSRSAYTPDHLTPVNISGTAVAGGATGRARRTGMISPLPSRCSILDTRLSSWSATGASQSKVPDDVTAGLPSRDEATRELSTASRATPGYGNSKGKRPVTCSVNEERSLMPSRGSPTFDSAPREGSFSRSLPTRLSPLEPVFDAGLRDPNVGLAATDADDDQSSDATVPSSSLVTLDTRRKRRRRDSTADEPRQHSAPASRPFRRRRLAACRPRGGTVRDTLSQRAQNDRPSMGDLSFHVNHDRTSEEVGLASLQEGAMELLEESHESLRAYLASYFESNRRLRAELAESTREHEELRARLRHAERSAARYQARLYGRR